MKCIRRSFNCYSKLGALLINEALLKERREVGVSRLAGLSLSRGYLITAEQACVQRILQENDRPRYVGPMWNMVGKELVAWRDNGGAVELMIYQFGGDDESACCLSAKRLANVVKRWLVDDSNEHCLMQILTDERLNSSHADVSIGCVAPWIDPLGMPMAELTAYI